MSGEKVILGAVGFQKNGYDLLAGSKPSKKELRRYIAQKAGLKDLVESTLHQSTIPPNLRPSHIPTHRPHVPRFLLTERVK